MDIQEGYGARGRIALFIFVLIHAVFKPQPQIARKEEMHILHSLLAMPVILRQEKAKTGNQARDGGQISGCIRFTPDCAVQNVGKRCKEEHLVDEVQKEAGSFFS